MFRLSFVLFCFCATSASTACVDGVNNVFSLDDLSNGALPIIVRNVSVATYGEDKKPSCSGGDDIGRPNVPIPGIVRVLSGQIIVKEKVDFDLYEAKFTVEKEGWFGRFNKVCKDGKDGLIGVIPCSSKFCKLVGRQLCELLANPGTYNLTDIKSDDIPVPGVNDFLHKAIEGLWKGRVKVESADGKKLADLAIGARNDDNAIELS
ncbi:hypothetical protein QR680_019283 [Steinernema hermaphroditum]|uniref:Uncharacterized protein n=1 Tax=Steinernema hermaphroditum TaxID=289476 RepID=A0AA39GMU7_9BILA|nr:hypothetical protein QR680_019283 [Steinernema hermaphroditum]